MRSTDLLCYAARKQISKWRRSHKGSRVETHHPSALVLIHDRLKQGVAHSHLNHESQTGYHHENQRKPYEMREGERDQACTEDPCHHGYEFAQSHYARS